MVNIYYLTQFLWVRNVRLAYLGSSGLGSLVGCSQDVGGDCSICELDWAGRICFSLAHSRD